MKPRAFGLAVTLLSFVILPCRGQSPRFSQSTHPYIDVRDSTTIRNLLQALLITERGVQRIEIVDITNNGLGTRPDVIITYPTSNVYNIEASAVIEKFFPKVQLGDFRIDRENSPPETFDRKPGDPNAAEFGILADLLRSLDRNYKDVPISLRLNRNEKGFTFQIWDHHEEAMQYTPFVCNDILYVIKTVQDTVYIPLRNTALNR